MEKMVEDDNEPENHGADENVQFDQNLDEKAGNHQILENFWQKEGTIVIRDN